MEVLGEGSDRSRQSIKRVKSAKTLGKLEKAPCTWSGLRPRSIKAVAPNNYWVLIFGMFGEVMM
jgi:hypothetical protein